MKIVITGGGSGGHITPILAVAAELKKQDQATQIIFIGQKGDKLADVPAGDPNVDSAQTVRAGKFRRYPDEGWKQLLDVKTQLLNLRDAFYTTIGIFQSIAILRHLRPDIIFTRGGFVSVPVGLAAAMLHIPYVTHDSDVIPSLANRIIARWAVLHAVALPEDLYPYPRTKTVTVGVPVSAMYQPVSEQQMQQFRQATGLANYKHVILVTGGGNGAHKLNMAMVDNAARVLARHKELAIIHIAGRDLQEGVTAEYDRVLNQTDRHRAIVKGFVTDLYRYSAAADVIIARGSATNLAEFAIQAKACVIVPAPQLPWTVKNAEVMAKAGAVILLTEDQVEQQERLAATLDDLLLAPDTRKQLGAKLSSYARPDAAMQLAMLLLEHIAKQAQN